ncbi:MAG: (2Fe-2S)-binding protein [Thermoanaerobaculales bacterium]|nr:(2Fe-2S)-binding protein [Thermoanaerobaculales bacterium]
MSESSSITFRLNGRTRTFNVPPGRRLLDLIREEAGMTGTKEGCGAGECGACTVLLDGRPVPSCLIFAVSCDGQEITTIEGLATGAVLHPIQEAMIHTGGVQCGFCTPGVVMTSVALLEHSVTDPDERKRRLAGNLCRCTGYVKIFDAIEKAEQSSGEDHV